MTKGPYLIGIDLGTSNCALSFLKKGQEDASIVNLEIPQVTSEGLRSSPNLPSFLYFLNKSQLKKGTFRLPFHEQDETYPFCLGIGAKEMAIKEPDRVIHSAKSWLSHGHVDRSAKLLPWNSDKILGDHRLSPIDVSKELLLHLKRSWDYIIAEGQRDLLFENQEVMITVPASFDALSQELTLKAAAAADYPEDTKLLEEPLSAFYNWSEGSNSKPLRDDKNILVCDIGGGTSDFTLLKSASDRDEIERVRVSSHILLGGDNIDLAIAHHIESKISPNESLASYPWAQLLADCRRIKESYLGDQEEKTFHLSLHTGGASLFGNTLSAQIESCELEQIIERFFPQCSPTAKSEESAAISEWGLPYASDPAISHHLAGFVQKEPIDYILFAGGTMKPQSIQEQILRLIESWQKTTPELLDQDELDLAVSKGAAAYLNTAHKGKGQILARFPKTLYVAVDAHEGEKALRILPKGTPFEQTYMVNELSLKTTLNQDLAFRVYESVNPHTAKSELVDIGDELSPIAHIVARLDSPEKEEQQMAVTLACCVSSTGLIQFNCISQESDESWPLHFDITGDKILSTNKVESWKSITSKDIEPIIKSLFGKGKPKVEVKAKQLAKSLEGSIGESRKDWDLNQLRQLWKLLEEGITRRSRSQDHEASWLYLAGYCLRPGFGHPQDKDFMNSLWKLYQLGIAHPKESSILEQWWILWRRVAGGLNKEQQELLFDKISPSLKKDRAQSPQQYLLAGSLERVDVNRKIQLGNGIVNSLVSGNKNHVDSKIWCLARLASRTPLYAGAESIVRPSFVESWADQLNSLGSHRIYKNMKLFYGMAGQKLDDRELDIDAKHRTQFATKLKDMGADQEMLSGINVKRQYNSHQQAELFGEEIPLGLTIV